MSPLSKGRLFLELSKGRHDNQHSGIQYYDTEHKRLFVTLSINDIQQK